MVWVNTDILLRIPPLQSVSCIAYATNRNRLICVLGQYQAVVTLRAVVSPGRTLRFDGKETTASNSLFVFEHARRRDDYEYPTRRLGNENFSKTIGLISKTSTLHVHHSFIFAFVCHFCTTTTWRCLILRFMDNVNKQRRNLFSFSLLNLDMIPWNSTQFAYIWQSK